MVSVCFKNIGMPLTIWELDDNYNDDGQLLGEDERKVVNESERLLTRISVNPLDCYRGTGHPEDSFDESIDVDFENHLTPHMNESDEDTPVYTSTTNKLGSDYEPDSKLVLLDDWLPPEFKSELVQVFDTTCPSLKSSPKLHDKVFRLVFSVGINAMILDAATNSMVGKLDINPDQLLKSEDSEEIFGNFMLPSKFDEQDDSN